MQTPYIIVEAPLLMPAGETVLFDAVIVQYVTSRDNRGTETTRSDNKYGVAVERSVVVHRSSNKNGTGHDMSSKRDTVVREEEEEISMSTMGAAPAGSGIHNSTERLKGDCSSEISNDTVDDLELGNKTNVIATANGFN
jgi:hypothetical protein